jgi:hypothetical protein
LAHVAPYFSLNIAVADTIAAAAANIPKPEQPCEQHLESEDKKPIAWWRASLPAD